MKAINLLVDLNQNMLHSYNSQEMIDNTVEDEMEYNRERDDNEDLQGDSEARQHLEEVCEKNGISPVSRSRSQHRKSAKEKRKNRNVTAPSCTRKAKTYTNQDISP